MLLRRAGQAVAGDALQVVDELLIAAGDPMQEREPCRRAITRRHRRDLGDEIRRIVRLHLTGLQVDDAGLRVEEPDVGVPGRCRHGKRAVCLGEALDTGGKGYLRNRLGSLTWASSRASPLAQSKASLVRSHCQTFPVQ
jgi:hypothetical protein